MDIQGSKPLPQENGGVKKNLGGNRVAEAFSAVFSKVTKGSSAEAVQGMVEVEKQRFKDKKKEVDNDVFLGEDGHIDSEVYLVNEIKKRLRRLILIQKKYLGL